MPIEIGSDVEGKVTGIAKFGAFVELPEGKVGLVHISQVADSYVTDVSKHIRVGDMVKVRVLGMSKADKYDLSIKQAGKPAWEEQKRARRKDAEGPRAAPGSFEDKITRFLKSSEEKLLDWKKNLEYKQSGRKKKQ